MKTKKISHYRLVGIHKLKWVLSLLVMSLFSVPTFAQVWTLQQCIDTASIHNTTLQISRNQIDISEQIQKESKANLIPKISAVADYKYFTDLPTQLMPQSAFGGPEGQFKETQFGVPHNFNVNLQFAMPLYNPQVYGAIKTTGIAMELAELQYRKTEEQVIFEVSNLYYNAQILQHQISFIDQNLENTTRLLANMQLLYEQLMAKESDVSKVAFQKAQLETQHQQAENTLAEIMDAMKFLMGIPFDQDMQIEPEIQNQEGKEYTPTPAIDLQIAATHNRLLTSELNTLKNSRLPSVSLFGTYGQTGFGYDEKPNDFLSFFPTSFAGVQVSYPLFNGTVTKRKINQKRIEIESSNLQQNLVAKQTNMQIENAKRRMAVTRQTIENNQSQIELATRVYDQIIVQQKEGIAGLTDVLLADSDVRQAQQNYLAAVVDYLKADLDLKKQSGNLSNKN